MSILHIIFVRKEERKENKIKRTFIFWKFARGLVSNLLDNLVGKAVEDSVTCTGGGIGGVCVFFLFCKELILQAKNDWIYLFDNT